MKLTVVTYLNRDGSHLTAVYQDETTPPREVLHTPAHMTLKRRNQLVERLCEEDGVTSVEANAIPWGTYTPHGAWGGNGRGAGFRKMS